MCALLARHGETQSALLVLAREKRRVIISCDTQRLGEINAREMGLISKTAAAERDRTKLAAEIAALTGISESELTVSAIIAVAEPDEARELKRIARELLETVASLREENRVNGELLDLQLRYTDAMLGTVAPPEDAINSFYAQDGTLSGFAPRPGFFEGVV
ncbi:MAG: flagellar protein FlgN [Oscillospiraceae bacterium]|jgi:flagellar biosynthesis/type III secretory pathway chaperone|nr:flagellar protein FlgN [Oscillospiraceae bacterium]